MTDVASPVGGAVSGPGSGPGRGPVVPGDVPAPVDRRIFVVAGALFAVLMGLSGLYGFHRDELYFLDCARHLSAGYVDQPVLTPLLARLSLWAFGVSLAGLRVWPALAAAGTVVTGGLLAREFGGRGRAQLLAALGTGTAPVLLGADHIFGPTAFDLLAWSALAFFAVRIGRTGDVRLWVPAGVVLGLGLANKHSIGFFAVALVSGVLASGGWRLVVNRWFLAGTVIAAAFTVPDLWWQATHHWPTIAMTKSLNSENGGFGNIGNWIEGQLFMTSVVLAWVWMVGLTFLWRSGRPLWRALVWAYGLLFVFFALTTGAKVYYLAGAYVYLLAAGSVHVEGWLDAHPVRLGRLLAVTALSTAVALPLVLPVLPARDIGWTYTVDPQEAETVGWPELVHTVASVWHSLSPADRTGAVIFTADYGEAGAINELGRGLGLPTAVSGHNTEWFWGPGDPHATTVVAVAPGPVDVTGYGAYLGGFFGEVRVVATLSNHAGLHNQEWGGHVYVCTDPRHPWGQMWPRLRHYD
jgi:4-amino-4-deoxy-L-arabinose transferase-like glycosyltransferase